MFLYIGRQMGPRVEYEIGFCEVIMFFMSLRSSSSFTFKLATRHRENKNDSA
jgi:hypothetical protein